MKFHSAWSFSYALSPTTLLYFILPICDSKLLQITSRPFLPKKLQPPYYLWQQVQNLAFQSLNVCLVLYVLLYINSLLLLSHFSRVRLCATPEMTAHQVPPSLGFSRQEHWSGLPFPSPMHESENESEVAQSGPTLSNPMDCSLPGPSSMGFSRQEYWSGVPLSSPLILYAPLFLVTSSIMPSFSLLKSHLSRPSSIIIPSL